MKYRKRPVVIEAEQWWPGKEIRGVFMETEEEAKSVIGGKGHGRMEYPRERLPYVITIHRQRAYLSAGDWVLPEPDGKHFYPCNPRVFETTYEPVED